MERYVVCFEEGRCPVEEQLNGYCCNTSTNPIQIVITQKPNSDKLYLYAIVEKYA